MAQQMNTTRIGVIGQGFVGGSYANDFEDRGFEVVRYAREEPFVQNKNKIAQCDIVFIAIPTPTTPKGFDDGILRSVVGLVGSGNIAVIKSTILPDTTEAIQKEHSGIFVLHSPEFLTARSAKYDAAHPDRNIIGIPKDTEEYRAKAKEVLAVLPKAPFELICKAREAELIKYSRNCLLYNQVVFINLLYDFAVELGCDWNTLKQTFANDPWLGKRHLDPIDQKGRGAGGACFIKDFEAFSRFYAKHVNDPKGAALLKAIKEKNIELLTQSGKDLDILKGVYGGDTQVG